MLHWSVVCPGSCSMFRVWPSTHRGLLSLSDASAPGSCSARPVAAPRCVRAWVHFLDDLGPQYRQHRAAGMVGDVEQWLFAKLRQDIFADAAAKGHVHLI